MSRDDCLANAAAYALGALGPSDAVTYERHLSACAVCRDEVGALRRVTDALPMAAPQYRVPARVRRRVVRTVRAESRPIRAGPRFRTALAGALAIVLVAATTGLLAGGAHGAVHRDPAVGVRPPGCLGIAPESGSTGSSIENRIAGFRQAQHPWDHPAPSGRVT